MIVEEHEATEIHIRWQVDKYLEGEAFPYESVDLGLNEMTTVGLQNILNVLTGTGTALNAANSYLGVGDGTTAFSLAQTDLQATLGTTATITAATTATPIVCTVSGSPPFVTGDYITITGGTGLNINGTWIAASVGGSTFSLTGSVGVGTYGASSATVGKANRFRRPMDATYPSRTSQTLTFVSTFGSAQANFVWAEWGLFWGVSGANMISRRVPGSPLGTKVNGNVWVLTATLTLS